MAILVLAATVAAVAGAMAWRNLRPVRLDLMAARVTLQQAVTNPEAFRTPEGRAATRAAIDSALASLTSAQGRVTSSVVLRAAGFVPLVAVQRGGLLELIRDARMSAAAAAELLGRIDSVQSRLQAGTGRFPLDVLQELGDDLGETGRVVAGAVRPRSGLWGPLGSARRQFDEVAQSASGRILDAADALGVARGFLGGDGDRRYFVALENNGEMRDQGTVLSYLIARFSDGRLFFENRGTVGDIHLEQPAPVPIPPGMQQAFGPILPNQLWQSVNATADFSWSGMAMAAMYRQATGRPVDGVIAVDVPALASLLRVVGPVSVTGISEQISADNAARILLNDLYQGLGPNSDQASRREKLGDVAEAVILRLTTGGMDVLGLGREMAEAAAGGHFRLWSSIPGEEAVFERTGLGGGPASKEADRTFHLSVQNLTATKLDYFVKASVRQEVQLTDNGQALVRTFVTIRNEAPAGPPSYQLGPDEVSGKPGEYVGSVLLWGPAGSMAREGIEESGLVLSGGNVTLGPGQSTEVRFETLIPDAVRDGRLELRLVPQSRLVPVDLDVRITDGGPWSVLDTASWQGLWDGVTVLKWRVER